MKYLSTTPFDLYQLHLFRLVVKHQSFTKAAGEVGLTQSAMTRQIQGMESSLGVRLLERTTRRVRTTPAGDFLFRESVRLTGDVEESLRRIQEDFAGARKEVRVGVAREVGLAYLPGFFHANLRHLPEVGCRMTSGTSSEMLAALEAADIDLAVICSQPRLPKSVTVTHRFEDAFTLLAPIGAAKEFRELPVGKQSRNEWVEAQRWIMLEESSNTGQQLHRWIGSLGWSISPTMQLDSFDLIINLVSLEMGVSFVPIRALALYGRKKLLLRLKMSQRFVREIVVLSRRQRSTPDHLSQFIANILF